MRSQFILTKKKSLDLCFDVVSFVYNSKVQSVRDACWNTPFWNAPGKVVCPYYTIIMQRSLRPLPIQAPGFEDVSLKTFSDVSIRK